MVAFYAMGLEHAIAVMFYLPAAGMIEALAGPELLGGVATSSVGLTLGGFLRVIAPVTLGNILGGGGVLVALVYWFVYLRPQRK